MTSRELVKNTLEFKNTARAPRDMWLLPWAEINYPEELKKIIQDFPQDMIGAPSFLLKTPVTTGSEYETGEYVDEWGCRFININRGTIGEVKEPILAAEDEEWDDISAVHIPEELLTINISRINEFCANTDKFVMSGCCPRPFERLQFIRGTENLYIDLMFRPKKMMAFIKRMHEFYCDQLTQWAKTDVDGMSFMDDWGSQKALLVNPAIWVDIFKPMYKDYIDIIHSYGKKAFMHSDGYTLDIIPHMIDLGLDAMNLQIFCIGIDKLEPFKGKITFWGEIDRQHLLPHGSVQDIENAVGLVREKLWSNGGCIAQCEFGAGARPENVYAVFKTWNELTDR